MEGNLKTRKKVEAVKKALVSAGIEPERVYMFNLSSAMGTRFAEIATQMTEQIRALGPTPVVEALTAIRLIRLPCSERMSPKFILAALRQGADGVWVSGCHPGDGHYIEGNYYARRKFALINGLLTFMGVEPRRVQFSWISSAESTKFVQVVNEVTDTIRALGPAERFVKCAPLQAVEEKAS